jgi:hypothetical protein
MTFARTVQPGLVSTIIPVLNRPILVIEAVAGVIVQTAEHDHFSILEELARPDGVILAALKVFGPQPSL